MTAVKTLNLFPVPLSICNFGKESEELNRSLIEDSFFEYEKNPESDSRSSVDGWQSTSDMEKKYESFAILSENIKRTIFSFLPKYGFEYDGSYDDVFQCNSLWSNILSKQSSYHVPHIHGTGDTILTGVYYPTSGLNKQREDYYPDENYDDVEIRSPGYDPGDIVLFDPAMAMKKQVIPRFVKKYPYYGSEISIKPKKGHLIIFPNYLVHMVAPIVLNDFYRVSISFNFGKKNLI